MAFLARWRGKGGAGGRKSGRPELSRPDCPVLNFLLALEAISLADHRSATRHVPKLCPTHRVRRSWRTVRVKKSLAPVVFHDCILCQNRAFSANQRIMCSGVGVSSLGEHFKNSAMSSGTVGEGTQAGRVGFRGQMWCWCMLPISVAPSRAARRMQCKTRKKLDATTLFRGRPDDCAEIVRPAYLPLLSPVHGIGGRDIDSGEVLGIVYVSLPGTLFLVLYR